MNVLTWLSNPTLRGGMGSIRTFRASHKFSLGMEKKCRQVHFTNNILFFSMKASDERL